MKISIEKCGEYKSISIDGGTINNVENYKITSSADGSTELVINIKADVVKYDLSAS